MLEKKKIIKVTGTLVATALVALALPSNEVHAQSHTQNATLANSGWVNNLFQQVWAKATKGQNIQNNNTEDSSNSNQSNQPSQPTPDTGQNEAEEDKVADEKPNTGNDQVVGSNQLADQIIKTGEKYMGTPYKFGAPAGQTNVFDCSSFVQHVYKQHGITLPRSSRQQSTVGTTIPRSQLKKGDLIFFKTSSSGGNVGHVGIYAGNNKILHTWGPGGVKYDSLSTGWLDKGYIHAKRVIK